MRMLLLAFMLSIVSVARADGGFDRAFFDRLLRIPSVTANVPEVNRALAEMRTYLEAGGVTCVVERLPDGRDTMWAATESGLVQDFVLCPHIDVVPAPAKMFEPAVRDGIVFGRGTSDDKGNAVVVAQLLRRLVGKASVGAIFTTDEEAGGLTTAHWVGKGVAARRAVLVLDASRRGITVGQKGHVYFTLRAKGVGAHSSRPWLGKNALSELAEAWTRIRQAWKAEMPPVTEDDWWHDTLEATVCHCGSVPNRIPDLAEMTVNLRFVEKGGDGRCEALMRRVAPELEITKGRVSRPVAVRETGGEIARLRSVMRAKWPGEDVPLRKTPGATDARHFTESRVPVAVVGASYKGLHGDDECAILSDFDDLLELLETYISEQEASSVVLYDASTPSSAIATTGGVFAVEGRWDLSSCGEIAVEFAEPVAPKPGINFSIRLENRGARPASWRGDGSRACYETTVRHTEPLRECVRPLPCLPDNLRAYLERLPGVRVNGLLSTLWPSPYWMAADAAPYGNKITSCTLDMKDVVRVSVITRPQLHSADRCVAPLKVRRIVARGKPFLPVREERFVQMPPEEFFPFIDRFGQFKWRDWKGKVRTDAELAEAAKREDAELSARPAPKGFDRWGGWADGPTLPSTGHFSVVKRDGKWWFVDPDGHLWWSQGPVRVSRSCGMTSVAGDDRRAFFDFLPDAASPFAAFYKTRDELLWPYYERWHVTNTYDFSASNLYRKYGPDWERRWAERSCRRLRSWGANTIANSSDRAVMSLRRIPYCDRIELKSRPIAATEKLDAWWPFRDPFDPSFREGIRAQMTACRKTFDDPWCFGFFVDNELPWGGPTDLAHWTWLSPDDQPAKVEFRKFLAAKYGRVPVELPCEEDLKAFSLAIARAYFSTVREEFKRIAPHKLYMGCRFSGADPFVIRAAAPYVDVMSFNLYKTDVRGFSELPADIDKPVIVGEYHFGALDSSPFTGGIRTFRTQAEKAESFRRYVVSALEDPRFVGVHWHQWADDVATGRFDTENFQNGWVDICDNPYPEMVEACRWLGDNMYSIRQSSKPVTRPSAPHWIDVMPLSEPIPEALVADAAFLGNETISDGIAWSCTLVPEGEPAMDKATVYAERFRRIAPQVRARTKIRQGFLVQATIGHGWTPGQATSWQKVVRSDGSTTYRFCPLGSDFRHYVQGQLRTLAAAKPDFFLCDDDTKLLGKTIDGCFCPLHLAGFAEKTGRVWSREDLAAAIGKGDRALADAWNAYTVSTLVDYARLIRTAFPGTIPGILCATPGPKERMDFVMPVAKALAGPGFRPVVRLGCAPYWSDGLYDILTIRRYVAYQRSYLGAETDVLVEADTCPQLRWQTSAARALDHLAMLTAEGCSGAKMWWHRLSNPHETRSSDAYLRALGERTGVLRWLADAGFVPSGVWCPVEEKIVDWGADVFGLLGIPYHYGTRAAGDVAALTADSAATLDGAALTNVLSGPVILDGSAAQALTRRGFGDLIGVRAKPWTGPSVSYEDFGDVRQSGSMGAGPVDLSDRAADSEELTRLFNRVSALADETTYLAPGSVWYANKLGGRIVTLAARIPKAPLPLTEFGYCNETRKAWLVKTLTRLAGRLPGGVVYLGDESVLCEAGRTRRGERVVIVDSLDLDLVENPEFAFDEPPSAVERLTDDGRWEPVAVQRSAVGATVLKTVLSPHRPAIFRLP